jgi:hypothetical protein
MRETRTPKVSLTKSMRSAGGVGVEAEEVGDGAGEAWQELAVEPAVEAVVGLLDDLLGAELLLAGGGGPADAEQAGDRGDLQARLAVQQEVAEDTAGVIVGPLALAEAEGGPEQGALLGAQAVRGYLGLGQPALVRVGCRHHDSPYQVMPLGVVYPVARNS